MRDDKKTKLQLIGELNDLRQRVREMEKSGTNRKVVEETQEEKEEKYRALIETTDTGYLILDSEGKVTDANKEYVRLSGHAALSEIIGRSVVEWTAEYDRERNASEVVKCLQRGFVRGLEIDYVDRKGRFTPIEIQATVIKKGATFQIVALCRDITARKQIIAALRLSEEKYQLLVNNANEGILVCQDLTIKFANPKAAKITGYSPEELLAKPLLDLVHPDDHEIVKGRTARRLRGEFVNPNNVYKGLDKNGRIQWIELNAVANNWEGRPAVLYFFQDITEIKQAREALLRAKEELELRVEERTTVLQKVNHKLQTELAERKRVEAALRKSKENLRLLSDQLINAQEKERKRISIELHDDLGQSLVGLKFQLCSLPKKLRQDQKGLKTTVEEALKNLDGMTDKVRRLSRDLRPAILEHLGLFEALQWLMDDSSKNYRFKIFNDFKKTTFSFSKEQEVNIFRIFQEALTNIGKHAQATRVDVGMTGNGHEATFSIKDDGKGFDPKGLRGRKPFEFGLGLTAMDERTRLIGGVLDIRSEVGRGTSLTFKIPKSQKRKRSKAPIP